MARIYYDFEFYENGRTIDPISVGMVSDDGRELYLINSEMPVGSIKKHPWLMANVWPHLPLMEGGDLNIYDPRVVSKETMAHKVYDFVTADGKPPEFWAYFSAYDHVCLSQLYGRMIDMPRGLPQYTKDIRHLMDEIGQWTLPPQDGAEHNALEDARWNKRAYDFLRSVELAKRLE